ncbi:hypothetical protein ACNKHM_12960 [Shigella sonnei]
MAFYLPEGRWTHLWHDNEFDGSRSGVNGGTASCRVCPFLS